MLELWVPKCREYQGGKRAQKQREEEKKPGQTGEGPCSGKPRRDHPVRAPRGRTKEGAGGWGGEGRSRASLQGDLRGGGHDRFPGIPPHAAAMSHLTDREALVKCVEASSRSRPCAMATLGPLRAAAGRYSGVLPGQATAPAETPLFTPVSRRPGAPRPLAGGPRI